MAKMAKRGLKNGFGEGVNNQRPPQKKKQQKYIY